MNESYGVTLAIDNFKAGNFADNIIDFYCPEARLAIELDGGGHNFANRESLNQKWTRFLASKNILVLRFWNYQINRELG
jgi:very-short-patch-repair endonuclease